MTNWLVFTPKGEDSMKDLTYIPSTPNMTGWQHRHILACNAPDAAERPILWAIRTWCSYANMHLERYDSPIGEDHALGPAWARWGFAIRELLNGDCGRLDCGTLDTIIHDNLSEQGFDPNLGPP